MQRRRYSLSGVYAAALFKHAVVGWGMHHADYEGVGGVSHTLSIQWCAVRARRKVLPIRRSVRTGRWSTPDVGRGARGVARMGFDYS